MGVLGVALTVWQTRDDSKPQAEIRRAANTAMATIDIMLAALHALRSQLVSEIRKADAQAVPRVIFEQQGDLHVVIEVGSLGDLLERASVA